VTALIAIIIVLAVVGAYFIAIRQTPTPPPSTTLPTNTVVGEFNVTLTEARWVKTLNSYSSSYKNGSFLLVSLTVENIGTSQRLFGVVGEYFGATGTAEIAVIDSKGIKYSSFTNVPLPASTIKWIVLPQMVGPKISEAWTIVFDVPGEAQDLRAGLRASETDEWTLLKITIR